eukprot:scaffold17576_cov46-Attheya_sp.AAC.3
MTDMFLSPPCRSRQQVRRICSLVWLIVIPALTLRMHVASAFVVVHHHPPVVTSFTAAGGRPFQGMVRTTSQGRVLGTGTELAAVEEWRQY